MKALVKTITCDEVDLSSYAPLDSSNFSITIRVGVGSEEGAGVDNFECHVCTPRWLMNSVWEPIWGRHLLIVREYDRAKIEGQVRQYVNGISGSDWTKLAEKISRNLAWEFEDYDK